MVNSAKLLGLRIKDLREARGWTQRECAAYLGFHHTYLAQLETGSKNMTLSTLEKIAYGFGITLGDLFRDL